MTKLKKIFRRVTKSDLTWAILFFSIYLSFFLHISSGISFAIAFILNFTLVKAYKYLNKFPAIFGVVLIISMFAGYYLYSTFNIVGVLLGTSISAFLMGNYSILKLNGHNDKVAQKMKQIIISSLLIQFAFSFYYFYTLVIQDVRGQNNLNETNILLAIILFIVCSFSSQLIVKKLLFKKIDFISYSNVVFVIFSAITFVVFYTAFLEIGTLNVILPAILSVLSILFINAYVKTLAVSKFFLKRTLSTFAYVVLPLTVMVFYSWNISNYLGMLFATLAAITFANKVFEDNKDTEAEFRFIYNICFLTNLTLILLGLFTLSTKGIITKLNIANIDYLIMLLLGIFAVFLLIDLREAISRVLEKHGLVGTYSVLVVALISLLIFIIFETGKTEALGTFLFGILATSFIKNGFVARNFNKNNNKVLKNISYVYLENTLLNLLTTLALTLMLVKI